MTVCAFLCNRPKTTPKYSIFEKYRYAYKNNSQVVNAVTSYRITINKVRKSQKIVASLYDKTLYFLLILTTFSMQKVTGNVRKELRLTRYTRYILKISIFPEKVFQNDQVSAKDSALIVKLTIKVSLIGSQHGFSMDSTGVQACFYVILAIFVIFLQNHLVRWGDIRRTS